MEWGGGFKNDLGGGLKRGWGEDGNNGDMKGDGD